MHEHMPRFYKDNNIGCTEFREQVLKRYRFYTLADKRLFFLSTQTLGKYNLYVRCFLMTIFSTKFLALAICKTPC